FDMASLYPVSRQGRKGTATVQRRWPRPPTIRWRSVHGWFTFLAEDPGRGGALRGPGFLWGGKMAESAATIRILLAEDDDSMRAFLARALERAGYEVTAVDRGTIALPLIASQAFDLLLTDIVMPE